MECLRDYIGIIGCGATAPIGGKYINTLPGISLESIESLADDEQKNFLGVWNDVQDRSLDKFKIEVTERFAKRFKLKQIRTSTDLLKIINTNTTFAHAAEKRGFSIEINQKDSVFTPSNLQLLYIEELSFYITDKTQIGANAVITIVDLDNSDVLDTFTIALASINNGWNKVVVNEFYSSQRIACVIDATSVESVMQNISTIATSGFYNNIHTIYGGQCDPIIRGVKFATADSPAFGSNTFGLTGVFSVVCQFDQIVCFNRKSFAYPLMYLEGSELMIERMTSSRTNYWTTLGSEDAQQLYKDFYAEFGRSLDQIIDSIDLDINDACLVCNEPIKLVETRM